MLTKKQILTVAIFSFSYAASFSQDTLKIADKTLEEVMVTATRSQQKLGNIAVPASIIKEREIVQSGSFRLNNILAEQTGLYITNSFGSGVQVQGLNPDYVLFLIDGEPQIGRNGGVLDLSRITVNNIKQIEIVKGPSSSLYGSEAMGGVINIITKNSKKNFLETSATYARFNAFDLNAAGSFNYKKFGITGFVNRNSSEGFDFNKTDVGKIVMPFYNYTAQTKLKYDISQKLTAGVDVRYYYEKQNNLYEAGTDIIKGSPKIDEINLAPLIKFRTNSKFQTILKGYYSSFVSNTQDYVEGKDSLYYDDYFNQVMCRIENQSDFKLLTNNTLIAGAGYIYERLNTNRYSGERTNSIAYGFLQDEHIFNEKLFVTGGIRYDRNAEYANRFSPKIAFNYKLNKKINLKASYGAGFKAPDYRQLYLNFTNNAAGGYTVYGANETSYEDLNQQLQAGIISEITSFGHNLKKLEPEYSTGINAGLNFKVNPRFSGMLNFFRNDIDNLIVTEIIAYKPSGAQIYSYFNINSALTQGVESELHYSLTKNISLEGGYQYLHSADKEVLSDIKNGKIFGKKEGSLTSYQLQRGDYGGLPDRSKHMANLKLKYETDSWFVYLRGIYRSRWGVADKDGNLILNRDDEYAKGFVQLNISAGKTFSNGFGIKAGLINITNYRDKIFLSNDPGINFYAGVSYKFLNNKKTNK